MAPNLRTRPWARHREPVLFGNSSASQSRAYRAAADTVGCQPGTIKSVMDGGPAAWQSRVAGAIRGFNQVRRYDLTEQLLRPIEDALDARPVEAFSPGLLRACNRPSLIEGLAQEDLREVMDEALAAGDLGSARWAWLEYRRKLIDQRIASHTILRAGDAFFEVHS